MPKTPEKYLAQKRARYAANREAMRARAKAEYERNRERKLAYNRRYYAENKDTVLARMRADHAANPEPRRSRSAAWQVKNKDRYRRRMRDYTRSREAADPVFKLVRRIRHRLYCAVKDSKTFKAEGTMALIGCSAQHLRAHLESQFQPGMTWENYGEWHVDHRRPCKAFNLSDPAQQRECFHWSNLQPLWKRQNLTKWCKHENVPR